MATPETARLTSVGWGQYRLSAVGHPLVMAPQRDAMAQGPTLESNHRYGFPGPSSIENATFTLVDQTLEDTMMAAIEAGTSYPLVGFIRGTAGNLCELTRSVAPINVPQPQNPSAPTSREIAFAAGDSSQFRMSAGMLFDHTIAHPNGVSSTVDGTAIQVGALSATQYMDVYIGDLHSPAPTATSATIKLQSASDEAFTVPNDRDTHTKASATETYRFSTLSGAITDTWWRMSVTAVSGGVIYPVCCVWIY